MPALAVVVAGAKRVAGRGGVAECQAMLDFAGEYGIVADVEVVGMAMDYVNTAIEHLERNNVRYRFVADVAGSLLGPGGRCLITLCTGRLQ